MNESQGAQLYPCLPLQINIQSNPGGNHQRTEDLSHGKREEDEPKLGIGLTEVFDAEPDHTVSDQIKRQHGTFGCFELAYAPQNRKKKYAFKKSLVKLRRMP